MAKYKAFRMGFFGKIIEIDQNAVDHDIPIRFTNLERWFPQNIAAAAENPPDFRLGAEHLL